MSVTLWRTIKNAYSVGLKRYAFQIATIGDTKSGTLIGTDDHGNQFYETSNPEEIHLRTRWVEYADRNFDISQVEPGWHWWLAYGTDVPPHQLPKDEVATRAYPLKTHAANYTATPGAYVPYNTAVPKCSSWNPRVRERL
ncbi:complex I NDUFA12 subunit family protein [Ascoidea rubescens DSM 1968]|uniref:NADH dehydrogenase [ubiquinone] 1 alpha subcomplex subunit n=1 Tax=Ascoidea rubescens DSM 1968 TaxID=1344418 RepID=A0A1D2VS18_9ASCO|nr:NADH:ubiquinone oxidoreductase 17.2 kd subunit [Ascoidea rubescens DSM 1968]ODV64403.1 NADH:ubiquinone oxidoreductase 17.2 kd subunit [Ascoidea rubescens DSM 1968]